MRGRRLAAAVAACVVTTQGVAGAATGPRLKVFAAASLTEVLPRIASRHAYSFGGSNQLAFQIRQGAPADVFVSASPRPAQDLFLRGLVERPATLVTNSLVLVVPRSNPAGIRSVQDLRNRDVKLVVGAAAVPIGEYTRHVLRRLGLASVLEKVVSNEPDAKGIVGKVALAQADAGFVYATDAKAAAAKVLAIRIPVRAQPTVRYEIAVLKRSPNLAAARAWVHTLRTDARARQVFRDAGFGVP